MASAAVTGAAGFIGSHLCRRLAADGWRVRQLCRPGGRMPSGEAVEADLADGEAMARAVEGADVVFHLAGDSDIPGSLADPRRAMEANALGTLAVLEGCRAAGISRVVLASSAAVYGIPQHLPIAEDHRLEARTPYAASKIAAESLGECYAHAWGLTVVAARLFNVYGPGQGRGTLVPSLLAQGLAGGAIRIGNNSRRDFTFVADVAGGLAAAGRAALQGFQAINLASGVDVAVYDLALAAARLTGGGPVEYETARRRSGGVDVPRMVADVSRAAAVLGWRAAVPLDQGLAATLAALGE